MYQDRTKSEKEINRDKLIDQRNELLSSLNYASLIQKAILPDNEYLDKIINDHFILNLPRDIVSGDFYYCTKADNNIIFAAGDCTGHGVPGALMSIMGCSFLNEITNSRGHWKASSILNLLRERVMKAMHQKGNDNENKDGIDMSLVVFNEDTGQLQFAGANNPIYHVRAKKLEVLKADKMPVGVDAIEEESFKNKKIQLISEDMIYLFSDGFADQFGGANNKKFKYGPFKRLLTEISDKELYEQKSIITKALMEWKGSFEQVDDVMVIGIKFI